MKYILTLPILFCAFSFIAQFQELGNYQDISTLSVVNPAFSGKKNTSASVLVNFSRIEKSQFLSASINSSLNGFNISHYNYNSIYSSLPINNSTAIKYARLIRINRSYTLRIGAGLVQNTFPVYTFINNFGTFIRKTQFSSSFGGLFESKKLYFGIAALNYPITEKETSFYNSKVLSIQSGLKFNIKKTSITPSILYLKYKFSNSLLFNLKTKRNWLIFNVGYRNTDNILLGIGAEFYRLNFNYTYNYLFSKLYLGIAKHNFQLTYQLKYRCKRKIKSFLN